jgi:hypothetical protein
MNVLAVGAFAVALVAMPLGVYAQQGQPPASAHGRPMPSEAQLQHRWAKRLGDLNLSSDQQQHIQSLIHEFSQAHPQGSAPDREANREFRRQLMGQLSDDQRNQFRQERQAHRAQLQQRGQMQGGPDQQGAPQGPPQGQGPPPDQGQGQSPDQGQAPPDQAPPSQ